MGRIHEKLHLYPQTPKNKIKMCAWHTKKKQPNDLDEGDYNGIWRIETLV